MTTRLLIGDCRDVLRTLTDESVHCCITSPPYWGLRDYGIPPSVWDGDTACEHEWGDVGRSAQRQRNGAEGGLHEGRDTNKLTENVTLNPATGSFCTACGAWLGCLGLEPTPQMFVAHMVEVFREVRRVMRADATLWLNLGDSYASSPPGNKTKGVSAASTLHGVNSEVYRETLAQSVQQKRSTVGNGLKPKDLCGIPWRVAFALQDDGWWLRQDIVWHKPNPMPESVTDRCTKSHEYFFLLAKSDRYYFDAKAIAEDVAPSQVGRVRTDVVGGTSHVERGQHSKGGTYSTRYNTPGGWDTSKGNGGHGSFHKEGRESGHTGYEHKGRPSGNKTHKGVTEYEASDSEEHRTKAGLLQIADTAYPTRNKRSVWTVATAPFKEAHFATFPPDLIEPAILAGCPEGGTVLDPFGGAGTTGLVADRLKRNAILIELNPEYATMASDRVIRDAGMFAEVSG